MPCKLSSATTVESASSSCTPVLIFWIRRPNTNATPSNTGTSARMNNVRLVFSVTTMMMEPISDTIELSAAATFVVNILRIWVTSLDSRETISPTRRAA